MNPNDLHVARRVRRSDLPHLVALNEFRVALVLASRMRPGVRVDLFLADHDLRRLAGKDKPVYIPDALVRLTTPEGSFGYVIEIDTGTESRRYVASRKVKVVEKLLRSGKPCWGLIPWRPVFITTTERRLRSIAETFVRAGAGSVWLASTFHTIRTQDALGTSFLTMSDLVGSITSGACRSLISPEDAGPAFTACSNRNGTGE
jgi:hypothetical protein